MRWVPGIPYYCSRATKLLGRNPNLDSAFCCYMGTEDTTMFTKTLRAISTWYQATKISRQKARQATTFDIVEHGNTLLVDIIETNRQNVMEKIFDYHSNK